MDPHPLGDSTNYTGRMAILHRLRELTALGATVCKAALDQHDWDIDKAFEALKHHRLKLNDQWFTETTNVTSGYIDWLRKTR